MGLMQHLKIYNTTFISQIQFISFEKYKYVIHLLYNKMRLDIFSLHVIDFGNLNV